MIRQFRNLAIFLILGLNTFVLTAQLTPSLIISSGMVIQRDMDIPLWGSASGGAKVYAGLNGTLDSTTADASGKWKLYLPSMPAGGPYEMTLRSGSQELNYTDIYIGDVWLASGQSNMQMLLSECLSPDNEIDQSDNQEIRQFYVQHSLGGTIRETLPSGSTWTPATQAYTGNFTAVGYYFAKYLYADLGIPIGIINCSYGGTRIESWMSQAELGYDEQDLVLGDGTSYLQPTVAYNTMLHPLEGLPVKGVIWYQGESNAGSIEDATQYRSLFRQFILFVRKNWGLGDIPFLWVQLPGFGTEASESSPSYWDGWQLVRSGQSAALSLPNTGEANLIDIGDVDIHPTNKQPFGKRLSLVARKIVYNEDIAYSGPRYRSHLVRPDGKIEFTFDHVENGLLAKDTENGSLKWFSLVRSGGNIVSADAVIENDKVLVWNSAVTDPVSVRYAWEGNPPGINFYNKDTLPAAPFYIDVYPGFKINSFKTQTPAIDRGNSTILIWKASGAEMITLNGKEVDSIGGARVWPEADSVFTLKIYKRGTPEITDSSGITISVRQPVPTISLSMDNVSIVPPGETLNISAAVSPESGAPVSKVRFYVNDILLEEDSEAPYEFTWHSDTAGNYIIWGEVENELGITGSSENMYITVKDLETKIFEAEDAVITGAGRIKSDAEASDSAFVELSTDWTLVFQGIELKESGTFPMYLGFMLPYGSPKVQKISINDGEYSNLVFEADDWYAWQRNAELIQLEEGVNSIKIASVWGDMRIDYLALALPPEEQPPDTTTNFLSRPVPEPVLSVDIAPNPFNLQSTISFSLPGPGPVQLAVYDLTGRMIATLINQNLDTGEHRVDLSPENLEKGSYLLRLWYDGKWISRRVVKY